MIRNILIIGGAGFLGNALGKYFLDKGCYRITILDKDESTFSLFNSNSKYNWVAGDILDYKVVKKIMSDMHVVINCAGLMPNVSKRKIMLLHSKGISNILRGALYNKVDRVIHISSPAVYGYQGSDPLYENAELLGKGAHAESKIVAEQICNEYSKKGLSIAILRPMPLVGKGRLGFFYILYRWIEAGFPIPLLGCGENKIQLLDVFDLCNAVDLLIKCKESNLNDTFNIGAEHFQSLKEDLKRLIVNTDSKSKLYPIPAIPTKMLLNFLAAVRLSSIYSAMVTILDKTLIVSNEKIKNTLGWKAEKSNAESLIEGYEWYSCNKANIIKTATNRGSSSSVATNFLEKILKFFVEVNKSICR